MNSWNTVMMDKQDDKSHTRPLWQECLLAVVLIGVVVASRWIIDVPNFKPVMAIAMLAGFAFHRKSLAVFAIVAGMLCSDALIGFYDSGLALVVYTALLCPVLAGQVVSRWKPESISLMTGTIGFSALAALNFYVLTTLAVWLQFDWYPTTLAGLGAAFFMGLPFLKWTLASNVLFTALLFGTYCLVRKVQHFAVGQRELAASVVPVRNR